MSALDVATSSLLSPPLQPARAIARNITKQVATPRFANMT
jgi:hypothetical protein